MNESTRGHRLLLPRESGPPILNFGCNELLRRAADACGKKPLRPEKLKKQTLQNLFSIQNKKN
jgi:hypothetical protein